MGRGDVEMLSLDGGVRVKRTTVLEMLNLIMTKRHQAIEETEYWYYLEKMLTVSCHGCCSSAKENNILYTEYFLCVCV